jgi:RimJ/RimL family protein N-acetyltransferase
MGLDCERCGAGTGRPLMAAAEIRTERLLLRSWRQGDREPFAALNADPKVMAFFPAPLSRAESDALMERIQAGIETRGWGFWALEVPGQHPFIGFVGLSVPEGLPCSPYVEIGWRLARAHWGRGYASEAARAALRFGFERLGLPEIVAFTAEGNRRSRALMERIGMRRDEGGDFEHPRVPVGHPLRWHVLYRAGRENAAEF